MKGWKVAFTRSALADIDEAYDWIAERDVDAADRWLDALYDIIGTLQNFPERCPVAPEGKFCNSEIREIFHGRRHHKYRILFECDQETVIVLHVRHGARLWLGHAESDE